MSEHDAEPVAGDVPPMPRPSPRSFGDVPLQTGSTSTLGIKVRSRDKAFYFLAARGGLRRYARRFPLTEDGWAEAWTAFATEDPTGAALYRTSLASASAGPATPPPARASRPPDLDDGWAWVVVGGTGWIGGAALIYEGFDVSGAMVLIGAALVFVSLVATLYGLVIEGIRLARRTS